MSVESKFNEALILTGFCALTLDGKLGAGIIAVGVGARVLKELRSGTISADKVSEPQKLNNITVDPNGDVVDGKVVK